MDDILKTLRNASVAASLKAALPSGLHVWRAEPRVLHKEYLQRPTYKIQEELDSVRNAVSQRIVYTKHVKVMQPDCYFDTVLSLLDVETPENHWEICIPGRIEPITVGEGLDLLGIEEQGHNLAPKVHAAYSLKHRTWWQVSPVIRPDHAAFQVNVTESPDSYTAAMQDWPSVRCLPTLNDREAWRVEQKAKIMTNSELWKTYGEASLLFSPDSHEWKAAYNRNYAKQLRQEQGEAGIRRWNEQWINKSVATDALQQCVDAILSDSAPKLKPKSGRTQQSRSPQQTPSPQSAEQKDDWGF